jgi:hypothetical protein
MVTHKYTGPNMRDGIIGRGAPLQHGDEGITGSKRGGLISFQRESDRKAFWVPPQQLVKL